MAHVMHPYYLYISSLCFLRTGNDIIANRGAMSGEADPLGRQIILNDFYKIKKSNHGKLKNTGEKRTQSGSRCGIKAPVVMRDCPADPLAGMPHRGADPVDGYFTYPALEVRGLRTGLLVRKPVMGEHQAQDPVAFDTVTGILFSRIRKTDPVVRFVGDQTGTREFLDRFCNGRRVYGKFPCDIGGTDSPAFHAQVFQVFHLARGYIRVFTGFHTYRYRAPGKIKFGASPIFCCDTGVRVPVK
jgi:hypothetical protein